MTIIQNHFSPDTCSCEIVYEYDDSLPQDRVVLAFHSLIHKGDEHAAIVDASILQAVFEENRRKERALEICRTQGLRTEPSEDGTLAAQVAWSYTAGRTLALRAQASTSRRTSIRTACDAALGIGKVTVTAL